MLLYKITYSKSYKHSYTGGGGCHAPAHQEQFWDQYLAKGHFDIETWGIEPATFQ